MEAAAENDTPVTTDRSRRMPGPGKLAQLTEQSIIAYRAWDSSKDRKTCCMGRVISINKPDSVLSVHRYAACNDTRLRIRWFPLYLGPEGEVTPSPGTRPSMERVAVDRVIQVVKMDTRGVLLPSSSRALDLAEWRFTPTTNYPVRKEEADMLFQIEPRLTPAETFRLATSGYSSKDEEERAAAAPSMGSVEGGTTAPALGLRPSAGLVLLEEDRLLRFCEATKGDKWSLHTNVTWATEEDCRHWLIEGYVDLLELWSGSLQQSQTPESAYAVAPVANVMGLKEAHSSLRAGSCLVDLDVMTYAALGWCIAYGLRPRAVHHSLPTGWASMNGAVQDGQEVMDPLSREESAKMLSFVVEVFQHQEAQGFLASASLAQADVCWSSRVWTDLFGTLDAPQPPWRTAAERWCCDVCQHTLHRPAIHWLSNWSCPAIHTVCVAREAMFSTGRSLLETRRPATVEFLAALRQQMSNSSRRSSKNQGAVVRSGLTAFVLSLIHI